MTDYKIKTVLDRTKVIFAWLVFQWDHCLFHTSVQKSLDIYVRENHFWEILRKTSQMAESYF